MARTSVIATTYFSRGSRGTRTDVVEFTDNTTLAPLREIVLPQQARHDEPDIFNVAYSADGHFVYVAYVTPAASFGVLDPVQGKVLGEIDTAGCVLVIPSGPNRVSSMCESGRLLTVTLDAGGHESARAMSEPFFDADKDPVFVQGDPHRRKAMPSCHSSVRCTRSISPGRSRVFAPTWSLVSAAEKGHWRPGGRAGGRHAPRARAACTCPCTRAARARTKTAGPRSGCSTLATHRAPGALAGARRRPRRDGHAGHRRMPAPILFAATATRRTWQSWMRSPDASKHIEKHLGQTPWMMLNP